MKLPHFVTAALIFCTAASCTQRNTDTAAETGDPTTASPSEIDPDLPEIPGILTDPADISAYALAHYWDKMDFSDTIRLYNDSIMDRKFTNFFTVFPYATPQAIETGIDSLITKSEITPYTFDRIMEIATRFLTSPNSSMRDEELYYLFLQRAQRSPHIDKPRRLRFEHQISEILKNRMGTPAADFKIVDLNGNRSTLYSHAAEMQLRLIFFYDPECEHCEEIINELRELPQLNAAIAEGGIKVMAIYPDGDMSAWEKGKDKIPTHWFNGYSPEGEISQRDLYSFPAMPVIYVIGPDNIVILKDPSIPLLTDWLSN